jgi:hypothetical protein
MTFELLNKSKSATTTLKEKLSPQLMILMKKQRNLIEKAANHSEEVVRKNPVVSPLRSKDQRQ